MGKQNLKILTEHRILYVQVINSLILKINDIVVFAKKELNVSSESRLHIK